MPFIVPMNFYAVYMNSRNITSKNIIVIRFVITSIL